MTTIKTIPKPELKSAKPLSPLEMNAIHFDKKHTVLTPELLEKIQSQKAQS